jgi:hypothetical protein
MLAQALTSILAASEHGRRLIVALATAVYLSRNHWGAKDLSRSKIDCYEAIARGLRAARVNTNFVLIRNCGEIVGDTLLRT